MTSVEIRSHRSARALQDHVWGRLGVNRVPRLAGLAVASPQGEVTQREVLERLGLAGEEFAEGIFARCGVRTRNLRLDDEFLAGNLQGRTALAEDELLAGATALIDRLGAARRPLGTVLSSSLYSLGCPTLAHRLVEHYGLAPTTDKYHLTGIGCASAVPLLRLGAQALHRHPSRDVLVVAAESMSSILMPAGSDDPRAKTVGSAIFGDGCAVAVLSNDATAHGPAIVATRVHHIGGTLGAVSLRMDEADSHLHLARELPDLAASDLARVLDAFLRDQGLSRAAVDHWIVHPGGRRIVEGVRDALDLDDDDVALSWQALAEHGNVGTPSIFYVLEDTIARRAPAPGERGLAVTVGPGVTIGLMALQW
jgi:predicted naringenin-chalcone synthase